MNSGRVVPFGKYTVDLLGDGVELLVHYICTACAERFHLVSSSLTDGAIWEDEGKFPYVCPTCVQCLREWQHEPQET
jgi:DNA-directed RNA polymerase subunit RPC12/RpoP